VIKGNSASITPPIVANVSPQFKDPYCDATESASACPSTGTAITLSSYPWLGETCSTGGTTLQPGSYGGSCAGGGTAPLSFTGGTTTHLCPGVYYLDGETTTGSTKGAALVIGGNGTTVSMWPAGDAVHCPNSGTIDGVTFIASCSAVNCKAGGGLAIGGQGSNTPTVTLAAPSTSPVNGVPGEILFHQLFGTADTGKGNSSFGGGGGVNINGVIHVPATTITLSGGTTFGSCTELIAAAFSLSGGATLGRPATSCNLKTDRATTIALVE
jgi:hypothetical protein